MSCNKIVKLLPLYISDDLGKSELSVVEAHLSECLNCYREYQAYLKSLRSMKRLVEKPELSPVLDGFTDEVMNRIAHDAGGPKAKVPRLAYAVLPRVLAAAAMLLVFIGAAYYLSGPENPSRPDMPLPYLPSTSVDYSIPGSMGGLQPGVNPVPFYIGREELMKRFGSMEDDVILTPVPQRFPTVQPVGYSRDF